MLYAIGMGSRERTKYARTEERKRTTGGVAVALLLGAMTLTGCDFSVSNPGPVADPFLDDAGAHQAIINGAQRELNYALGVVGMDDGASPALAPWPPAQGAGAGGVRRQRGRGGRGQDTARHRGRGATAAPLRSGRSEAKNFLSLMCLDRVPDLWHMLSALNKLII